MSSDTAAPQLRPDGLVRTVIAHKAIDMSGPIGHHAFVPRGVDEFEAWYAALVGDEPNVRPTLKPWLRQLYEREGAVSQDRAWARWQKDRLAAVQDAVDLALSDVHATTTWRPEVRVWLDDHVVLLSVAGHTRGATTADPMEVTEIVRDVAQHIQDDVCDELFTAWPVCARHDVGLHAVESDQRVLWWCNVGDHAVAAVGELNTVTAPLRARELKKPRDLQQRRRRAHHRIEDQ